MLIRFFLTLRAFGLKPGLGELLHLVAALREGLAGTSIDAFYALSRSLLVKDETRFDLFDRAFAAYFHGVESLTGAGLAAIPPEWLIAEAERVLSDAEKARLRELGGVDELLRQLAERLREQREAHRGGSRWIGTAGTSPFGNAGFHPAGVRIGGAGRQGRAVKVWERREYANLDDQAGIGTRQFALALRKLRRFAREGAAEELDLAATIDGTARRGGWLDLRFRPERHNAVKVLLFLDVGGSMDPHVAECEALFSAARAEFKHLEHYYFHNCVYERVWRDNRRRYEAWTPLPELLHTYAADYRLILVGDASMAPQELVSPGGSVEHWNEEPGEVWLQRLLGVYPRAAWLNPLPQAQWDYTPSIGRVRELLGERMYPLTLDGLGRAIDALRR